MKYNHERCVRFVEKVAACKTEAIVRDSAGTLARFIVEALSIPEYEDPQDPKGFSTRASITELALVHSEIARLKGIIRSAANTIKEPKEPFDYNNLAAVDKRELEGLRACANMILRAAIDG